MLAIIVAAFAADAVRKGGGIAMGALYRVSGVEPVSAGKSSHVPTGAGLTFLRYCHSGGTLSQDRAKFQGFRTFVVATFGIDQCFQGFPGTYIRRFCCVPKESQWRYH